jgi:Phage Mu protein F like protein.
MTEEARDTITTLKGTAPTEVKELQDLFGFYSEDALREAEARAGQAVTQTTRTQRALVNQVAQDAIVEGLAIRDIALRIDDIALTPIYRNRSVTIARTEIVGASNRGKYYAAKGTSLKLNKKWLATPIGDFREDHVAVNGMEIALDDEYDVGGVRMLHPHSPGAPADQVVNCRCTYRMVVPDA